MAVSTHPFGELLRGVRKRAGLSPRKLAFYLNVPVSLIKEWETGRSKPPRDPEFHERFREVPGFTPSDVSLLREAAEADKSTKDIERHLSQIYQKFHVHMRVGAIIRELVTNEEKLQDLGHWMIRLNRALAALDENEAQDSFTPSFTKSNVDAIISAPMPPKEVEHDDYLTEHISDLQAQATFGAETKQRPVPYPHENVPSHVARLQEETQGQQTPPPGSGVIYEKGRITTIAEASRVTGVKLGTVYNLLNDGKLTERGRIFFPARGGGKVLINLDELDSIPKKPGGRPRKTPKRLLNKRPRGRPRKTP